jgi:hypothetical protein
MENGYKGALLNRNMIQKITMTSYDGSAITPSFSSNSGMTISVKVKNSTDNGAVGSLSVPLTFGAAIAALYEGDDTSDNALGSIVSGSAGT